MQEAAAAESELRQDYIYEMLAELGAMARQEGLDAVATVLECLVRWRREPMGGFLR